MRTLSDIVKSINVNGTKTFKLIDYKTASKHPLRHSMVSMTLRPFESRVSRLVIGAFALFGSVATFVDRVMYEVASVSMPFPPRLTILTAEL